MNEITIDSSKYLVGSVLRNAVKYIEGKRYLINPKTEVEIGDIILCKVMQTDPCDYSTVKSPSNFIERIKTMGGKLLLTNEQIKTNDLAILPVGNRFSTQSFAGGLYNPITFKKNGTISGGTMCFNLGHMNVCGFLNYNYGDENPAELLVIGVLEGKNGKVLNICDYKREIRAEKPAKSATNKTKYILVIGDDMEVGKTTCARTIAKWLSSHGISYSFQKITGGPRIRDIVQVINNDGYKYGSIGTHTEWDNGCNGVDFTDVGYVSSHSVKSMEEFIDDSLHVMNQITNQYNSRYHIIEIAGYISQKPNLKLLNHPEFLRKIDAIIVALSPNAESLERIYDFFINKNGFLAENIVISGKIIGDNDMSVYLDLIEGYGLKYAKSLKRNIDKEGIENDLVRKIIRNAK